jgi:hypothetical protein
MATDKHPCGHATCECLIEGTDAFCSSYCAEAASAPAGLADATCACGHRACASENTRSARSHDSIASPGSDASGRAGSRSRASAAANDNAAN